MAFNTGIPVVILASGGRAITQVTATKITSGQVMTPTTTLGQAVTLVSSGGLPVVLINPDGTEYVP